MTELRYKAFISYSHRDEAWAKWLHRAMERYRLPRRLVGTQSLRGSVPARLSPVFRDRDELSSAADLSGRITDALTESASLVVICSPESANSKWVNEEIRFFRSLGRGDRIFCVIVDGDPKATNLDEACFPPALLEQGVEESREPLAADARKWADGKTLAKLKLISGILGIRLDELRQREQQRKNRNRAISVVAALAIIALIATATISRIEEKVRREHAQTLVTQIVEISDNLDDVADLETLRDIGERLASYLDTLDPNDLTPEARLQIGLVLRQLGEVSRLQGRPEEAMGAFNQSRDILASLAAESSGDLSILFELGQAEFWISYIYLDRGAWDEAEVTVTRYLEASRKLHEAEPENAKWAMEVAYALSSLGTIQQSRLPANPDKGLAYMRSAMEYNLLASSLAPNDDGYKVDMADTYANLADALLDVCKLEDALISRMSNVGIAADFFEAGPNNRSKRRYAYSLSGLAWVQRQLGMNDLARENLEHSVDLLDELSRQDSSDLRYRWNLQRKIARLANLLGTLDRKAEAWNLSPQLHAAFARLEEQEKPVNEVNRIAFAVFLMNDSDLAWHLGENDLAELWLEESKARLRRILELNPESLEARHQFELAGFLSWQQSEVSQGSHTISGISAELDETPGCNEASLSARLAMMRGDINAATVYTSYLLDKGYLEPGFMRFCSQYELCESGEPK